jgi:hypothetical protein
MNATATKEDGTGLCPSDRDSLRRLGARVREIAEHPANRERRDAWYALDSGKGHRVMVLTEHEGIRDAVLPVPDSALVCADPWARAIERELRGRLYHFEVVRDDRVVDAAVSTNWRIDRGHYGVEVVMHQGGDATHMGSRRWDPPIQDLDRDFAKLRPRTFSVDREATFREKTRLEAVFGGILDVRLSGSHYWTMGMTWKAIELIGLEGLMLALYDNPDGLHRLMAFLRDDHLAFADWLEREGLYSLNNANDSIGSGSYGFTRALPRADWTPGSPVRTRDLWVLLESQETVGVGPDLFEAFIFPYQRAIAERFGRCYYGCCEPVNSRWHVLERLPNLERVSVSPWADEAFMARTLGNRYVYSRKPNPSLISTGIFDEGAIRADLRHTLEVTPGCRVEIIMKDVHTLSNEPDRLARWVRIAREEIAGRQA